MELLTKVGHPALDTPHGAGASRQLLGCCGEGLQLLFLHLPALALAQGPRLLQLHHYPGIVRPQLPAHSGAHESGIYRLLVQMSYRLPTGLLVDLKGKAVCTALAYQQCHAWNAPHNAMIPPCLHLITIHQSHYTMPCSLHACIRYCMPSDWTDKVTTLVEFAAHDQM